MTKPGYGEYFLFTPGNWENLRTLDFLSLDWQFSSLRCQRTDGVVRSKNLDHKVIRHQVEIRLDPESLFSLGRF
jgi:hypothetical protein